MTYNRNCPICNCVLTYVLIGDFNRAVKQDRKCKSCASKKTNEKKKIVNLTRNCPKCNVVLTYKVYHTWWWAKKTNQSCRSCVKMGKSMPEGFSEKISKIVNGEGNPMFGKRHSELTKQIISFKNSGNKSKTGQTVSEISKEKMRLAVVDRIKRYGKHKRGFNPNACKYLDSLTDYKFKHALNGGEFCFKGYFADGYDEKQNVWIEYDEPHHFTKIGELREKDLIRMQKIKLYLGCKFLRYDEKREILKEC